MKKVTLLVLLFSCVTVTAQQWDTIALPKKCDKIGILTTDSNYRANVIKVLALNGYNITYSDSSVITTSNKTIHNASIRLNVIITPTDSGYFMLIQHAAELPGYMYMGTAIANATPINVGNRGANGSPMRNLWDEYEKVCKQIKGKLYYWNNKHIVKP